MVKVDKVLIVATSREVLGDTAIKTGVWCAVLQARACMRCRLPWSPLHIPSLTAFVSLAGPRSWQRRTTSSSSTGVRSVTLYTCLPWRASALPTHGLHLCRYVVDIASIRGGRVPIDPESLQGQAGRISAVLRRFFQDGACPAAVPLHVALEGSETAHIYIGSTCACNAKKPMGKV